MAMPVYNYEHFLSTFERTKGYCDLFGFILFDDRPSHGCIKQYCVNNFNWLDDLAATNSMVLFVPIKQTSDDQYDNCSMRIAREFNLLPRVLPAFLFFTLEQGQICVKHSSYLKFRAEAFAATVPGAEDLISDLFSAVGEARQDPAPDELVIKLDKRIARIKRDVMLRPIKRWALDYVLNLANLPSDILKTMAEAYGRRLAGQS